MNLIGEYQNGNYLVSLFSDGTKIRETKENEFSPLFCECIDIKITNYCDMNCPMCHEDSSKHGLHGNILQSKFINTLHSFTELAIGGGNPLSHPDLICFLEKLKEKNIIANLTVNQKHFEENQELIDFFVNEKLIYGLGISLINTNNNFIQLLKKYPNSVLHIINGIIDINDLKKLYDENLKILILGYKYFRRGKNYYSERIEENKNLLYSYLPEIIKHFNVTSFDNLAIKQLEVNRLLSKEKWDEFYMGDDGQFTMYVDMVKEEFAKSSTSIKRYPLQHNIVDMFNIIRNNN